MSDESSNCRLTIILSVFILLFNATSAWIYTYLPDDPFHIAFCFSVYSYFASTLSILGLIGAIKRKAIFIYSFANFLLIDATLCAIPRLAFMMLFSGLRESLCAIDSVNAWEQRLFELPGDVDIKPFSGGENESVGRWIEDNWSRQTCMKAGWWAQVILATLLTTSTVAQLSLALRVRGYAILVTAKERDGEEKLQAASRDIDNDGRYRRTLQY